MVRVCTLCTIFITESGGNFLTFFFAAGLTETPNWLMLPKSLGFKTVPFERILYSAESSNNVATKRS